MSWSLYNRIILPLEVQFPHRDLAVLTEPGSRHTHIPILRSAQTVPSSVSKSSSLLPQGWLQLCNSVHAQSRLESVCPGPPLRRCHMATGELVTKNQTSQWENHEPCFMFYMISQRVPLEWSCVVHWRKPFSRLAHFPNSFLTPEMNFK